MIDQQSLPTSLPFEESDTEETRVFTEFYLKYRRERRRMKTETKLADYDWTGLPDTFPIEVWIYKSHLLEFTSGISNTLNDLRRHIIALRAWDAVFDGLDDKTKQRLLIEFINPVATNVINLPHVIKARFGYAVAHLSFHANRARDDVVWKDDFPPERDVELNTAHKYAGCWKAYKRLQYAIEAIAANDYRKATREFRDRYVHRFPPHIEVGMSDFVTRERDAETGRVSYRIGGLGPIPLKDAITQLEIQHALCFKALDQFKKLVLEQIELLRAAYASPDDTGTSEITAST